MYQFYSLVDDKQENCYYIDTNSSLNKKEIKILTKILANGFIEKNISLVSKLNDEKVIEIGPRLNFATAFSSNAVSVCHNCGLKIIIRIEKAKRYDLNKNDDRNNFIKTNHDKMTEIVYEKKLENFKTNLIPKPVYEVKILEQGIDALKKINKEMGLGMDDWDEQFYFNLFINDIKRNPTNVECFQLGQANSEHSRHWFFKGRMIIDGKEKEETLLEIVQSTLKANIANSLIAFTDNSSAIKGYAIETIIPKTPGKVSYFIKTKKKYNFIFTAETHNFPTGIAPFSGAETGSGGRIRDVQATGKGSLVVAGTAGYAIGNLNIPKYNLVNENKNFKYPDNLASALKIQIDASNGVSDYGNKFGEPLIQGFNRSFGQILPDKTRQEWIKPILFSGGVGQIDNIHIKKYKVEIKMCIIQIGGPAYRIGMGGGAASSMIQGENKTELDFNAVQRGDAEIEQKINRVIRACVEMGNNNPIISIHDQGAGGPCNVLTELVEPIGGKIEIRKINLGDKTMSVLEIWGCEYQERQALLIKPNKLKLFLNICKREHSDCEILGTITGDGKIIVYDNENKSTPVNLELSKILGKMPKKIFKDTSLKMKLTPLIFPNNLSFEKALENVLHLPSVCSKRFLTTKVDRSVTGLIARQQCVGPLQLPLSDVAVIAQSHFNKTGAAISIGEQPIKILVNPEAGARMSVGEALTNIVWAKISKLENIKCSGNWMWPAKLPGEASRIYQSASAMRDLMIKLGIAIDGGKDSLSMATKMKNEIIKSPEELVISAYSSMPDINKVITPDIKYAGESELWIIDLGKSKCRLGGSALAQTVKQIGNQSPDVDDAEILKQSFLAIQELIEKDLIISGHDRSDGGLITTLLEMAFAGNCGLKIKTENNADKFAYYFNEELGYIIEVKNNLKKEFLKIINKYNLNNLTESIAKTIIEKEIIINHNNELILKNSMQKLRDIWEETSHQINLLQTDPKCAQEEKNNIFNQQVLEYKISFKPQLTTQKILNSINKPKIAIIREEGSNGDREMASAFYSAGFEVWDVTMSDLHTEKIKLDKFRGIAFVGGFSYADVFASAKGWASNIKFNPKISEMFSNFYNRPDTFSLGVCNGCQLMTSIGWVPFKNIKVENQPMLIKNKSKRFESRWSNIKIKKSPSIMLKGMENSILGVWVAHGEGCFNFPDKLIYQEIINKNLAPIFFVDDKGEATEKYPFNPNGSINGITSLCSENGRHLAMMPHPERAFLKSQWPWMSEKMKKELKASPWLKMFQNAYEWCKK
ncbi:phosphoribosylformylglycinamidine synthase [Candidatus Kuenenbacteria bacterium HGW-Kuenenbacteria-1]|uniref:Phosphoribosylformylglycinamidine synthase n=1 Tax=Candidatus Kuenenbacteria bacterium HGW-Kuenenbacteria-1 TaxID=2013812 RepID=A0A2N1UNW9_9BACT|nr:MAG: phosphoribosylformylglycinamidine synthase [Candidatus Kuenenbacteria bacterium HGW-Kuenenbacteria-1]